MNRFRILMEIRNEVISWEQGAVLLKMSVPTLKQINSKYAHVDMNILVPYVDKLMQPALKKNDHTKIKQLVAKLLGAETTRHFNRQMHDDGVEIPPSIISTVRKTKHEKAQVKFKHRDKLALDVIADFCTADYAADQLGITKRQVYRVVNDMLKPLNYTIVDLREMPKVNREKLAKEVVGDTSGK